MYRLVLLILCAFRYASTYFELCSLVPSEEAIKNQLHQVRLPTVQISRSTERRDAHMKRNIELTLSRVACTLPSSPRRDLTWCDVWLCS